MKTKRLNDISYLRSFAIIAIVLYHSFCPYMRWDFVESDYNGIYHSIFNIWLGARMPLFLFISGYLFSHLLNNKGKYTSYSNFILNKGKRLIIPYLVFATLLMLSHHSFSWSNLAKGYWHLWFILMLFWSFLITWPLKYFNKPSIHLFLLIVFTACSFYAKPNIEFGIKYLAYYYIWFYWGYILVLYKQKLKFLFNTKAITISIGIWFTTCFVRDYFGIPYEHLMLLTRYISNLAFIIAMFASIRLLTEKGILNEHPFIEQLNINSYGIYIAHIWIITLLFNGSSPINIWIKAMALNWPIAFPIVLFIFTFLSSLYISNIVLRTRIGKFLLG